MKQYIGLLETLYIRAFVEDASLQYRSLYILNAKF